MFQVVHKGAALAQGCRPMPLNLWPTIEHDIVADSNSSRAKCAHGETVSICGDRALDGTHPLGQIQLHGMITSGSVGQLEALA